MCEDQTFSSKANNNVLCHISAISQPIALKFCTLPFLAKLHEEEKKPNHTKPYCLWTNPNQVYDTTPNLR